MRNTLVSATVLVIVCAMMPLVASADTYEQVLEHNCPNAHQIASLRERDDEAEALLDKDRFALERALAREDFRCSQQVSDPYLHDAALLVYGNDLLNSFLQNDGDALRYLPFVAKQMNDLAAATMFEDIRHHALALKKLALSDEETARNELFGAPSTPNATATPRP